MMLTLLVCLAICACDAKLARAAGEKRERGERALGGGAGGAGRAEDRSRGMLVLGMYGDALGAPTEDAQMRWEPPAPVAGANESSALLAGDAWEWAWPNVWKIWPPPALVGPRAGVTTDDTAQRVAAVQLWMRAEERACFEASEADFAAWTLAQMPRLLRDSGWLAQNQASYFGMTLCMWETATAGRYGTCRYAENPFYTPDEAISFGLYMYLEYAGSECFARAPPHQVYRFFRDFCSLDALYAKDMTAFGAALISSTSAGGDDWRSFLYEGLALMPNATLRQDLLEFWDLGTSMQGSSLVQLETKYRALFLDPKVTLQHPMRNHDPLFLFRVIYYASGYASTLEEAFIVIANCPGDTDTTASYFGLIVGAFLGLSRVPAFVPVRELVEFQETFFGWNLTRAAQLYLQH